MNKNTLENVKIMIFTENLQRQGEWNLKTLLLAFLLITINKPFSESGALKFVAT